MEDRSHRDIFKRREDPTETKDFCYGMKPVEEAVKAGKTIDKLLVQKGLQGEAWNDLSKLLAENEIAINYVPFEKLNRVTRKNHQGIIAFISPVPFYDIEQVLPMLYEEGKTPFILALDGITDVRNFGAICRTAYCAGVDAIIVPEKGGAAINGDAVKTSAGAMFNLKICKVRFIDKTLEFLKMSGLKVIACTEKESEKYHSQDLTGPAVLVMGSEDKGISEGNLKLADIRAGIPMIGDLGSLNVSVAAGVLLYEIFKQRNHEI